LSAFSFAGVSVAVIGGKGWEAADRWAALGAACIILYNSWRQIRPAILELGDVAPDPGTEARIRSTAAHVPGVLGLDKCFVRKMGLNFYADLHIVVNGELCVRDGHHIAHQVDDEILKACPKSRKFWYTWNRKKN